MKRNPENVSLSQDNILHFVQWLDGELPDAEAQTMKHTVEASATLQQLAETYQTWKDDVSHRWQGKWEDCLLLTVDEMVDYVLGSMPAEDQQHVEQLLAQSVSTRQSLEQLQTLQQDLLDVFEEMELPPEQTRTTQQPYADTIARQEPRIPVASQRSTENQTGASSTEKAAPAQGWIARLEIQSHHRTEIRELDDGSTLLGASETCDIFLQDPLLSRVHGLFVFDRHTGSLSVADLSSTNGSVLLVGSRQFPLHPMKTLEIPNDNPEGQSSDAEMKLLQLPVPQFLRHGDRLRMGNNVIQVELCEASQATAPMFSYDKNFPV